MREKEYKKKRYMEAEENRGQKYEDKRVRKKEYRSRGLEIFKALVHSVLTF